MLFIALPIFALLFSISSADDNATVTTALPNEAFLADPEYQSWKLQANPTSYASLKEERYRYGVYSMHRDLVNDHNAKNLTFKLALNNLADQTLEEIKATRLGLRMPPAFDAAADDDESNNATFGDFPNRRATTTAPKTTIATTMAPKTTLKTTTTPKTTLKTTTTPKTTLKTTTTPKTTITTTTRPKTAVTTTRGTSTAPQPTGSGLDWRTKGAVTPVKDQGQCGSCWAFSVTGALEGRLKIKTGQLVSLSDQNLLDCSTSSYGQGACNGGWPGGAYTYIRDVGGINSQAAYPYKGASGSCRLNKTASALFGRLVNNNNGYANVPSNNQAALMQALQQGPVAVSIDVGHNSFSYYSSGIYTEPACTTSLNHAVLLVGYGSENGRDYWIVKNSWGSWWGEKGYIRMARGSNLCGILNSATYPILA